jgi:hypothetical protein
LVGASGQGERGERERDKECVCAGESTGEVMWRKGTRLSSRGWIWLASGIPTSMGGASSRISIPLAPHASSRLSQATAEHPLA